MLVKTLSDVKFDKCKRGEGLKTHPVPIVSLVKEPRCIRYLFEVGLPHTSMKLLH